MLRNEEKTAHVMVVVNELPSWATRIFAQLAEQSHLFTQVKTIEESLMAESEAALPDVMITLDVADSLQLSRALDAQTNAEHRPLLIYLTNNLAGDSIDEYADVILPYIPHIFEHQLNAYLKIHREKIILHQKLHEQEQKSAQLADELEKQKRLGFEIEILKNAIVRNVSHELRTPLLHVKSAVALIAEDIDNEELINYAKGATGRLEILVKNITLLGSSLDINPGPVIIRESAAYAKRNLGRIWEHRNDVERIQLNLATKLPPVLVDKQGLSTILQLLMDNALKFSKESIEVTARVTGDSIKISVIDKGIGIEADHLESIFDIFYQIDPSSTRKYGGTGVGLAIVRLILERHNTWIEVDSQIGKGSTFSFSLPIVKI